MNNYNLKIGMEFKSYKDFSDFIGYEETKSREVLKNRLKHHCEFHKKGNIIIIDAIKEVNSMYVGRNKSFKYKINDIVKISTGEVKIIDCFFKTRKNGEKARFYKCKCMNDGYVYDIAQYSLLNGVGCRVCLNKIVLKGVNDIATTNPEIAKLLKNKKDTTLYTQFSGKQVEFKCPYCGNVKLMKINTVSQRGHIECNRCGDNFSYPNKFVYNALQQICKDIKCEVVFDWSNKKRYDLYSKEYNLIVENQGGFHYKENNGIYNVKYPTTKINDIYKRNLAISNGISNYVELDCKKSELNYIKKSILESELPKLLNFNETDINWEECEKYATSSIVYDMFNAYKNGVTSKTELSKIFNVSYNTCVRYLDKAFSILQ